MVLAGKESSRSCRLAVGQTALMGNNLRNDLGVSVKAERRFVGNQPFTMTTGEPGKAQPITMRVRGEVWASSRRRAGAVKATQPAVGPKPGRAMCMNTALPRPAMRGAAL